MEKACASRPWYRLHAVTWSIAAVIVAAIGAKNLEVNAQAGTLGGAEAAHGWPVIFAYRDLNKATMFWFDGKQVVFFDATMLLTNFTFGATVSFGAVACIEKACRRYNIGSVFSLRFPLAVMALVACYFAVERPNEYWDWHIMWASQAITWFAVALAWLAFFDVAGAAWKRIAERRGHTSQPK